MSPALLNNIYSANFEDEYDAVLKFAEKYNKIEYSKFDYYTMHNLNLFALREDYDFIALEKTLDKIVACLPAIKRIFTRPITRLMDLDEVLPVESVRVINNRTIIHTAMHSEQWGEVTANSITPKKLLTVKHKDDYVIYENIGFAYTIDIILGLINRNLRILHNILFTSRNLKVNLLERDNHPSYFLAVGKLHIGYVRDYDKYRPICERCINKILFIKSVLSARLSRPVYTQCRKHISKYSLKKTMVFRMHKDYNQVYRLLKWFSEQNVDTAIYTPDQVQESNKSYPVFCTLLSLFAVGHFNFIFESAKPLDFFKLSATATFKDWKLSLKNFSADNIEGIEFCFKKDTEYKIFFVCTQLSATEKQKASKTFKKIADEVWFCDTEKGEKSTLVLSLFDIESFRRIQQLVLKGMIYSDQTHSDCPFCSQPLSRNLQTGENEALYECDNCRTRILKSICSETGDTYFATTIKNRYSQFVTNDFDSTHNADLYDKYLEGRLFYRNITDLTQEGDIVCPICQKAHLKYF